MRGSVARTERQGAKHLRMKTDGSSYYNVFFRCKKWPQSMPFYTSNLTNLARTLF